MKSKAQSHEFVFQHRIKLITVAVIIFCSSLMYFVIKTYNQNEILIKNQILLGNRIVSVRNEQQKLQDELKDLKGIDRQIESIDDSISKIEAKVDEALGSLKEIDKKSEEALKKLERLNY